MTNSFVPRRTFWKSTIHITVASETDAIPAQKSVYELAQRLLLIGNAQFHMEANIMANAPTANSPARRSVSGRCCLIQRPARLPNSAVQMAGMVESTPSGSHVLLDAQRWLPRPQRLQSR